MKQILLTLLLTIVAIGTQAFSVRDLKTEYTTTPLGIDNVRPCFSWQMNDTTRGAAQTAYQITVKDNGGAEVWNSGKVASTISVGIHYAGQPLKPRTRYIWTVTVWNNRRKQQSATATSWFETGLLSTTDTDKAWGGARWIGGSEYDSYTFYSQYLPVFRVEGTMQLDKKGKTSEAGLIYGANDMRLMDKNKNILGVANGKDESYIKVVLNIAPLFKGDSATIDVYRVGYTTTDKTDVPFASRKIPTSLINKQNCYGRHSISISSVCGTTNIWLDGRDNKVVGDLNVNPMGKGGDYTAFPVVGDVGFYVPAKQKVAFSNVTILNYRDPAHVISKIADNLNVSDGTKIFTPKEHGAPMLRTEFVTEGKKVAKARIYATARGIYELFLNGERVSDDYLNPGLTQYNRTLFYQTYDVTNLVKEGENALGAQLNEGWWSGNITFDTQNWNFFGDRQSLLAELIITYTDGTEKRIVTDPADWKYSGDGPVRYGSLFQGEVYDATCDSAYADWATASFDDAAWTACEDVPLEGVISHQQSEGFFHWPAADDYSDFQLIAQVGKPVGHFATLTAQKVDEPRPDVFVYDMGQNMAGVPRVTFSGLKPGTKVSLRYAEVRYPDLPEYKNNVGMVMMENQRAAMEQDIYIAKGGTETFSPRYTYHGFRYIEITGIPSAVPIDKVRCIVLSSVDSLTSSYETDNKDVNRLFKNVQWSTLANAFSVPTDCPQRNERMGWSGDLSVFSPTMSYMFNGAEFFRRHLRALREVQLPDGNFTAIAPIGGGFGGPLWSSVGVVLPWQSYVQYGDIDALSEHYDAMKKYIDLQTGKFIGKDGKYSYPGTDGLGDWLGFEVNKNNNPLLFDCYLVHELDIMEKAAIVLGKEDDARRYNEIKAQRIKFINTHYINNVNGKTETEGRLIDTQTSYVLPIAFNIVDTAIQDKFYTNFLITISRKSTGDDGKIYPPYSLMTGFIGTAWISLALSHCGLSDYAYRMLENKEFPSWLYPVEQGATTIWERLNSYTKADGFGGNNSMNSFNHYAFGSVTNWIMQRSLGISRDETSSAFKHFIHCPEVDTTGGLKKVNGHYDSMYGRIESSWQTADGTLTHRFTIPPNTSATLVLPVKTNKSGRLATSILIDGRSFKKWSKEFPTQIIKDDRLSIEIPAGKYSIDVK